MAMMTIAHVREGHPRMCSRSGSVNNSCSSAVARDLHRIKRPKDPSAAALLPGGEGSAMCLLRNTLRTSLSMWFVSDSKCAELYTATANAFLAMQSKVGGTKFARSHSSLEKAALGHGAILTLISLKVELLQGSAFSQKLESRNCSCGASWLAVVLWSPICAKE